MRLLLASPIDPEARDALTAAHSVEECGPADLHERATSTGAEVLILRSGPSVSAELLAAAPQLRLVIRAGSGLDNIDLEAARAAQIRIVRVAGMSAPPVAEFTFALLLALARKVTLADRYIREGHWPKSELGGPLLRGKVLGVIGAGNIGTQVGEMAHAWGMTALGCVAEPSRQVEARLARRGVELTDLDVILDRADFVTLHVPLTAATHRMIDADALDRMRPGSLLVNMARGGVVDEKALYESLTEGSTLAGAALDVHETEGEGCVSPLASLANVILTPHIGAMALDSQRLIGARVTELVSAHQEGRLNEELNDGEHVV